MAQSDGEYVIHSPVRSCPFCEASGKTDGYLSWRDLGANHRPYHVIDATALLASTPLILEGGDPKAHT